VLAQCVHPATLRHFNATGKASPPQTRDHVKM
jgi:hypothetical protein